jgi:uncharacterized protein
MHPDAAALIALLGLSPHPEGGFYRETFRSPLRVEAPPRGGRDASTAIYFLLPAGTFSAFHRVTSDEVWHHYDGDPLLLFTLGPDGTGKETVLGRDFAGGQRPQHVVPAGVLQACRPLGDRYTLAGCTVAPGFTFDDFEMPTREALLREHPTHESLILSLTR